MTARKGQDPLLLVGSDLQELLLADNSGALLLDLPPVVGGSGGPGYGAWITKLRFPPELDVFGTFRGSDPLDE